MKKVFCYILKNVSKILYQSLTNPDNEYSSKKLTMFVCLNISILMAMLDQLTRFKLNENVFYTFMLMASGQSILTIVANKVSIPTNQVNTIDTTVNIKTEI
jgi:hypothetical protein